MKQCHGKCLFLDTKSKCDSTAYSKGYKMCSMCELSILAGETEYSCPCCKNFLRVRSKSGVKY